MKVLWRRAESPLPAVAVVAPGDAGAILLGKATYDDELTATAFADWAVVEGPDLPWVDGALYLGKLPGAADVLVPVHQHPELDPDLVRRAARSVLSGRRAERIALIPQSEGVVVLPLGTGP